MLIKVSATSPTKQDEIEPSLDNVKELLLQSISKSLADYLAKGCKITDFKLSVAVDDIEAITEPSAIQRASGSAGQRKRKRRKRKGRRRKK